MDPRGGGTAGPPAGAALPLPRVPRPRREPLRRISGCDWETGREPGAGPPAPPLLGGGRRGRGAGAGASALSGEEASAEEGAEEGAVAWERAGGRRIGVELEIAATTPVGIEFLPGGRGRGFLGTTKAGRAAEEAAGGRAAGCLVSTRTLVLCTSVGVDMSEPSTPLSEPLLLARPLRSVLKSAPDLSANFLFDTGRWLLLVESRLESDILSATSSPKCLRSSPLSISNCSIFFSNPPANSVVNLSSMNIWNSCDPTNISMNVCVSGAWLAMKASLSNSSFLINCLYDPRIQTKNCRKVSISSTVCFFISYPSFFSSRSLAGPADSFLFFRCFFTSLLVERKHLRSCSM
mmetsp:Transcript_18400/g.71099  ORF Transcript_18400/g.71099 Transcript_18400/m.71099 type:complete len:349 (+) Transcript_18400:490-1536(+)